MKDYSRYKAYDLLQDEDFLEYCFHPDKENSMQWKRLQETVPGLEKEVTEARRFLSEIHIEKQHLQPEEKVRIWMAIERKCRKNPLFGYRISAVAAVVLLLLTTVAGLYWRQAGQSLSGIESVGKPDKPVKEVLLVLTDRQETLVSSEEITLRYDVAGKVVVRSDSADREQQVVSESGESVYHQLLVPAGKRSSIVFPDGTKVWVNAGSRVVYPVEFDREKREVYVEGEAYLEVAKNENRPFYVKTKQFKVKVLGTSFNVRAYEDETEQGVVLVSGKVNVKTKDKQEAVLTPNDHFVLQQGKMIVKWVDVYEYISWKDGILCFERSCVGEILRRLGKYYGVEIDYDREVEGLSCSGKLELKNDVKEVLKSLAKTAPIEYKIVDNHIKIKRKRSMTKNKR